MSQGSKLAKAKEILKAKGLKPHDYAHLTYSQILALAGVK